MKNDCPHQPSLTRGAFLFGAASVAAIGSPALAANASSPMTAEEALDKLKQGNAAFAGLMTTSRRQTIAERAALGKGQAPFASILACADSRVTPEIVFNQGLGDIFVVRVAGNVVTATERASLEYGAAVLKSPLIVVMGHSSCGAVKAAIDLLKGESFPGDIQALAALIEPAAKAAKTQPGDWTANAIRENVRSSVRSLESSAVLSGLLQSGGLKIVGSYYDLDSGIVTFL